MAINFERALGVHQHTLGIRAKRTEMLASNIANADTPHYKARDISFSDALAAAKSGKQTGADAQIMLEKMETDKEPILLFYDTIEEANAEALSWT